MVIGHFEHGLWDIHFLGDMTDKTTPFILQVPENAESFQGTYMSSIQYNGHAPSLQQTETIWYPVDSTDWIDNGTSIHKDFIIKSGDTNQYLGPIGWAPSEQNNVNGATLWTCTILNGSSIPPNIKEEFRYFGYLGVDETDFKYIIYDNAKDKYVPRLGVHGAQHMWLFHLSQKDVSSTGVWNIQIQVPEHAQADHFPKWYMSSDGRGKGNDDRATKNRHTPCLVPSLTSSTRWTAHVIGLQSKTETETVYLVHLETNNHLFLSSKVHQNTWRPSVTPDASKPDMIAIKLVLLNGATLPVPLHP